MGRRLPARRRGRSSDAAAIGGWLAARRRRQRWPASRWRALGGCGWRRSPAPATSCAARSPRRGSASSSARASGELSAAAAAGDRPRARPRGARARRPRGASGRARATDGAMASAVDVAELLADSVEAWRPAAARGVALELRVELARPAGVVRRPAPARTGDRQPDRQRDRARGRGVEVRGRARRSGRAGSRSRDDGPGLPAPVAELIAPRRASGRGRRAAAGSRSPPRSPRTTAGRLAAAPERRRAAGARATAGDRAGGVDWSLGEPVCARTRRRRSSVARCRQPRSATATRASPTDAHRPDGTAPILQARRPAQRTARNRAAAQPASHRTANRRKPRRTRRFARPRRRPSGRVGRQMGIGLHCGRKWDRVGAACRNPGGRAPPTQPPGFGIRSAE